MSGQIYKSIQFSVYCYSCDNLEDFESFKNQNEAESIYRKRGWSKTKNGWKCPECKGEIRKNAIRSNPEGFEYIDLKNIVNRK